jgi:hypothetical protein|uniref:Uncharacterized protein n=1 Tax=viral metagenome TaxID=1070528 RepID=A0A6C0ISQ3_9ZZZZ
MNQIYFIIIIIFVIYHTCVFYRNNRVNKEKFQSINDAFTMPNKRCTAIYGNSHPKCMQSNRLKHVGYFKFNTIKYPLLDLDSNSNTSRYVMLKDKFARLNKKHWNRGYYFKSPFHYHKTIPFSVVFNYTYRGTMSNEPTNRSFHVFGKKIDSESYNYILFREKAGILQYAYKLSYRKKLEDGDPTFIRNKISTFGPFIFSKD